VADKKKSPIVNKYAAIAADRHFKLPVYSRDLDAGTLGSYYKSGVDPSLEFIAIDKSVPQSSKDNEENLFQRVMKHELVHALQARMGLKGQDTIARETQLNPLTPRYWDAVNASRHFTNLSAPVGSDEAEAYTLSNTVDLNKNLNKISNPYYQDIIRRAQLEKLRSLGLLKESKIWE